MKQNFNVGVATCYGIHAALIVDIMVSFCRSKKYCFEYREGNNVFVPWKEIRCNLNYISDGHFKKAIDSLMDNGIITYFPEHDAYSFTELAKLTFAKSPIRITINWQ